MEPTHARTVPRDQHQWSNYLHTAYVLVRQSQDHHCKLCSDCGQLLCEVHIPTCPVDYHKRLVAQFHAILDKAATEYDPDSDGDSGVVDDFHHYAKDWANQRELERPVRRHHG